MIILKHKDMNENVRELFERGYTYSEIARALGVTRSTVAGRLYRMRQWEDIERRINHVW